MGVEPAKLGCSGQIPESMTPMRTPTPVTPDFHASPRTGEPEELRQIVVPGDAGARPTRRIAPTARTVTTAGAATAVELLQLIGQHGGDVRVGGQLTGLLERHGDGEPVDPVDVVADLRFGRQALLGHHVVVAGLERGRRRRRLRGAELVLTDRVDQRLVLHHHDVPIGGTRLDRRRQRRRRVAVLAGLVVRPDRLGRYPVRRRRASHLRPTP